MNTTCLISNYNYGHFLGDALDSALRQTVPFDQITVVDDGSSDSSLAMLRDKYQRHSTIEVVAKQNQGQLSCFNEGFARAQGEIVFFLDADDVLEPNYVEQALNVYQRDPSYDFVFCGHRQFGDRQSLQLKYSEDRNLGYSVILASHFRDWIGAPTSCLSMRRSVLEKILPLPFTEDWRTRADDCLVFGASLVGARKYFLAQPLVQYRVHSANQFFGKRIDKCATYRRRLAVNALFKYLERKLCYDLERLTEFHHREFCTIDKPAFKQLVKYCRIGLGSRVSYIRRLSCLVEMAMHYTREALSPARHATTAAHATEPQAVPSLQLFAPSGESANPPSSEHEAPYARRAA